MLKEISTTYRNKKHIVAIQDIPGWANKLTTAHLDDRKIIKIIAKPPQDTLKLLLQNVKMIR